MHVLEATNLTKRYGGKPAVDGVTLTVEKGDIFGLIGQNGAGKTTFMRMATGLTRRDEGEIKLFGEREPKRVSAARARMGAIIETPALYANLSAVQNMEYYRIQRGITDGSRISKCLETVKLTDTDRKKVRNFSLGMKQRLGLALAILSHPDFLILDEPVNGLDPTGIIEMRDLIKRLNSEGITLLISSHILTELAQVANKYAIIHHGRLIKSLTHAQLQEECKSALAVTVDDAAKAAVTLETALGILDYKQISSNEIRIYSPVSDPSEVTFRLSQAGVRVAELREVGDTLEEYYIKLIGGASK
ncbi:MAG: ABC transporter ATP-binding protein [Defluviitaleaceae bacterium]|nr:ABC transporter ATP-binding protein [Defluviitaleaceae bacterium]